MACDKTPAETSKTETMTEAQSVEQKDVGNLLVTVSFSSDEETTQQICSNPNPETAFNGQAATCRSGSVDVVS